MVSSVILVRRCLHGAGRKSIGREMKLVFLLEFFVMGCLNLSLEMSLGTQCGHPVS